MERERGRRSEAESGVILALSSLLEVGLALLLAHVPRVLLSPDDARRIPLDVPHLLLLKGTISGSILMRDLLGSNEHAPRDPLGAVDPPRVHVRHLVRRAALVEALAFVGGDLEPVELGVHLPGRVARAPHSLASVLRPLPLEPPVGEVGLHLALLARHLLPLLRARARVQLGVLHHLRRQRLLPRSLHHPRLLRPRRGRRLGRPRRRHTPRRRHHGRRRPLRRHGRHHRHRGRSVHNGGLVEALRGDELLLRKRDLPLLDSHLRIVARDRCRERLREGRDAPLLLRLHRLRHRRLRHHSHSHLRRFRHGRFGRRGRHGRLERRGSRGLRSGRGGVLSERGLAAAELGND
mmetsp:Transcript_9526/g.23254  ORF Transcript_9526/g.23254 Transcript_9526/m.23254 type:complete len:350 (-) Transcript_9526:303-1352(-)